MSGTGATAAGKGDDDLEDPGRDPQGIGGPSRNPLGGADQDTGAGAPRGTGNVGPGDKPEAPTEDPESRADTPDAP